MATGELSVGSCQKLLPCRIEPMPAGSKMNPLLAKAKPFSDSGSASGTTDLRRGKNRCRRNCFKS